jgi:hypothetical protein
MQKSTFLRFIPGLVIFLVLPLLGLVLFALSPPSRLLLPAKTNSITAASPPFLGSSGSCPFSPDGCHSSGIGTALTTNQPDYTIPASPAPTSGIGTAGVTAAIGAFANFGPALPGAAIGQITKGVSP